MALKLGTNIEAEIKEKIQGNVVRIGSSVDQLMDYKNCKVTDINMLDGGFGDIKKIRNIKSIKQIVKTAKRYTKQKVMHTIHGEKICRDWKTIILDAHSAYEHEELAHKFDACISSNVLEHSPNPVLLLLNFYYLTKKGGYQYHAFPHYKYIYDMYRQPTTVDHLLADFVKKTGSDDTTHNDDYIQNSIIKHGGAKRFHENNNNVAYPIMHFHVFDENNVRELFQLMFTEVTNDVLLTNRNSDNVVIFRNDLNENFIDKYRQTILEYSKNFLQ